MIYNTRFNPTCNGPLHLGHLYLALVNEVEAHQSGGKFIVRFDDNQQEWIDRLGQAKIDEYAEAMAVDLTDYVQVDCFTRQSQYTHHYHPEIRPAEKRSLAPAWNFAQGEEIYYPIAAEWIADGGLPMYPFAPPLTAEHVANDHEDGINWLIRGQDLVTEFSLYEYLREWAGFPLVRHTYIPRLCIEDGSQLAPISKTGGGYSIREMTEQRGRYWVLELLRTACLIDPEGTFQVSNIKFAPRLDLGGKL